MEAHVEKQITQILTAKERRAARQHRLIQVYGGTVVSLTLNFPGGYRRYGEWQKVWAAARQTLKTFDPAIKHSSSRVGLWGPETFLVVSMEPLDVKKVSISIEEEHPLGRLFDIDVIDPTGRPVSRTQIGKSGRPCLLCDKRAIECYRNRTHLLEELIAEVKNIIQKGLRE